MQKQHNAHFIANNVDVKLGNWKVPGMVPTVTKETKDVMPEDLPKHFFQCWGGLHV